MFIGDFAYWGGVGGGDLLLLLLLLLLLSHASDLSFAHISSSLVVFWFFFSFRLAPTTTHLAFSFSLSFLSLHSSMKTNLCFHPFHPNSTVINSQEDGRVQTTQLVVHSRSIELGLKILNILCELLIVRLLGKMIFHFLSLLLLRLRPH